MFDNKVLIQLYVLPLDKKFEVYIPVNEKIGNIINLFSRTFMISYENRFLLNLNTGVVYKNNDLVRDVNVNNFENLMLI